MRIRHIAAIIAMHSEEFTSKTEWVEVLYWWISSTLTLGFLGKGITAVTGNPMLSMITIIAVMIVRPTFQRGATTMARLIVEELGGRVFLATMSTPVTLTELTTACTIVSIGQGLARVALGYMLLFVLFGINPFSIGWISIGCLPFLIFAGFALGLFISALVYVTGKHSNTQLQVIGWSLVTFCGAYAPVASLPHVFQTISWLIPVTYVFEGMRASALHGLPVWPYLCKSVLLTIPYAMLGTLLLYWAFRCAKNNGLAELEAR